MQDLYDVFVHDLGVSISHGKLATVSTSSSLLKRLGVRLKAFAGECASAGKNLGIDYAPGVARGVKGATKVLRKRLGSMHMRAKKLKKWTKRLLRDKGRMGKIYTAGLRPAVDYGAV
eukprot:12416909-Karenia_brevis.AAC.1